MEFENIKRQVEMSARQEGKENTELSEEENDELFDIAKRRVALGLVLAEIGRLNNISVNEQELQRAVIQEAQKYPGQEKMVFDYYSKNRQVLESLRAPLFEEKVIDFVLGVAKVTEKKVSLEELQADDEEENAKPKTSGKKKAVSKGKKADTAETGDDKAEKKPAAKKKAPAKKKAATDKSE